MKSLYFITAFLLKIKVKINGKKKNKKIEKK